MDFLWSWKNIRFFIEVNNEKEIWICDKFVLKIFFMWLSRKLFFVCFVCYDSWEDKGINIDLLSWSYIIYLGKNSFIKNLRLEI